MKCHPTGPWKEQLSSTDDQCPSASNNVLACLFSLCVTLTDTPPQHLALPIPVTPYNKRKIGRCYSTLIMSRGWRHRSHGFFNIHAENHQFLQTSKSRCITKYYSMLGYYRKKCCLLSPRLLLKELGLPYFLEEKSAVLPAFDN